MDHRVLESANSISFLTQIQYEAAKRFAEQSSAQPPTGDYLPPLKHELKISSRGPRDPLRLAGSALHSSWQPLSPWSGSWLKRFFDCACVFLALPVLVPLMLAIAVAVRFTSRGPALFRQERVGRHGQPFTIFKFRTMVHVVDETHLPITTLDNQRFTAIGPFLRRWKLDELPQLVNVLLGHMSLVGPRPKLPEHMAIDLPCRPGITGMATNIFAREEEFLARVPQDRLDAFYHAVVLPAKHTLDAEYMAQATFLSDLRLLFDSVLRRWDETAPENFFLAAEVENEDGMIPSRASDSPWIVDRRPIPRGANQPVAAEKVSA